MNTVVVDYGIGNIHSVISALKYLQIESSIDIDGSKILSASKIIIPGVSNFGEGIRNLKKTAQFENINKSFERGSKIIGLCLGAQMMFKQSDESPLDSGFGFIDGKVVKIDNVNVRVPNQGWSRVESNAKFSRSLFEQEEYYYFSHTYKMLTGSGFQANTVNDGHTEGILAAFEHENITGVQFHPELSGPAGLKFLQKL